MILQILQHTLGRNQYGKTPNRKPEWRNHFYTGPDSKDWGACIVACAQGLMWCRPDPFGGDNMVFHVTDAGRQYMLANSPKPPVKAKIKKVAA